MSKRTRREMMQAALAGLAGGALLPELTPKSMAETGKTGQAEQGRDFDSKTAPDSYSIEDANADLPKAQEILFQDLPAIPLWYGAVNAGYSTVVENVEYGWDSWPIVYEITKE